MWQTYVAIGDSMTEGYGDPVPGIEMRGWTDRVAEGLRNVNPRLVYHNLGFRGSTTATVRREQLPAALEAEPDLLSITVGANDALLPWWSVDAFSREYDQLLAPFVQRGAAIVTFTYPDLQPLIRKSGQEIPPNWQAFIQRLEAVNAAIRQASARVESCLLDFAPVLNPAHMSGDLVHPNALGYKYAAESALAILAERYGLPLIGTA